MLFESSMKMNLIKMIKYCAAVCLFLTAINLVFAHYQPLQENPSKQYKIEVEKIIDEEYPHVINNIDDSVKDAKKLRDKILANGFNLDDYISLSLIPETRIPSADLDLYAKLLQITQEKYLGVKYKPLGTDSVKPFEDILFPCFQRNDVNIDKLNKIIFYENKQIEVVEKYIKEVEKFRPTSNQYIF